MCSLILPRARRIVKRSANADPLHASCTWRSSSTQKNAHRLVGAFVGGGRSQPANWVERSQWLQPRERGVHVDSDGTHHLRALYPAAGRSAIAPRYWRRRPRIVDRRSSRRLRGKGPPSRWVFLLGLSRPQRGALKGGAIQRTKSTNQLVFPGPGRGPTHPGQTVDQPNPFHLAGARPRGDHNVCVQSVAEGLAES